MELSYELYRNNITGTKRVNKIHSGKIYYEGFEIYSIIEKMDSWIIHHLGFKFYLIKTEQFKNRKSTMFNDIFIKKLNNNNLLTLFNFLRRLSMSQQSHKSTNEILQNYNTQQIKYSNMSKIDFIIRKVTRLLAVTTGIFLILLL